MLEVSIEAERLNEKTKEQVLIDKIRRLQKKILKTKYKMEWITCLRCDGGRRSFYTDEYGSGCYCQCSDCNTKGQILVSPDYAKDYKKLIELKNELAELVIPKSFWKEDYSKNKDLKDPYFVDLTSLVWYEKHLERIERNKKVK